MSLSVAVFLVLLPGLSREQDAESYKIPARFEPGVRKVLEKMRVKPLEEFKGDAALKKEFEALASAGRVEDILEDDSKWMPFIIDGLLSDDEKIASGAFRALHGVCGKRKISIKEARFENPVRLEYFNSAYYRAGDYGFWSDWWSEAQNQAAVRRWKDEFKDQDEDAGDEEDARLADWDNIMSFFRTGEGFDDPERPEGYYFQRVKRMGRAAYPHLVRYLRHEELQIARGAARVLGELTGRPRPRLVPSNREEIAAEWERWLATYDRERRAPLKVVRMMASDRTEAEVRRLLGDLASDKYRTRCRAQEELEGCALRHAVLLQQVHDRTDDTEVRYRLTPIILALPRWRAAEARIRSKPDLLLDALQCLPPGTPEEDRRRIEKLHQDLKK